MRRLIDILTRPLRALMYAPGRLLTGSRRLLGLSVPARAAILVELFLVICVVIVLVAFAFHTPSRTFLSAKLNWQFVLVVLIFLVAIPIVLYKALKLWLEGEVSPFPDIDHAWKVGLAELEKHGLDLSQVPLFLVFGSSGEKQEKAIFDASRLSLNLREIPPGPAAIHWHANPDGVYLVCTETSCLSKLAAIATHAFESEKSGAAAVVSQPQGGEVRGTIVAGSGGSPEQSSLPTTTATGLSPGSPADYRGTMIVGGQASMPGGPDPAEVRSASQKTVIKLSQPDATEQNQRLQYLCRLIRRARQPLCPINGILTLIPFGLMRRSAPESIEIQLAIKKDLSAIARLLLLRCPVTAIVVGMEEESGFRELVRRVGRDRAAAQRFGKGFSLWNPPLPERLEALAAHACGSFEDWVYTLFREKGSLSKPGNTKLYALLGQIRRTVQNRLAHILVAAFSHDPEHPREHEPMFFSGCYFAATGETEDRQAFVKGIFDKLADQQEEVQWTKDAYDEDQKYQFVAQLCLGLNALLGLGLLGLIVHRWFWPWLPF